MVVLAGLALEVYLAISMSGGHFSYSLDDPYIHLRLAEMIGSGGYGINPGEFAAPSSSILWPLLLAPFASTAIFEYMPLIVNAGCLVASFILLFRILSETWREFDPSGWIRGVVALAVCAGLNLVGLAMTGMEHSLQVALVLAAALGVVRLARGSEVGPWFWAVIVALPLVRYEDLSISVVALAVAFVVGHRRAASITGAVTLVALGGFSIFLMANGMPPLPSSVLVKSRFARTGLVRATVDHVGGLLRTLASTVLLFLVGAGGLVAASVRARRSRSGIRAPEVLLCAASCAVMGAHLLLGEDGWFGRYEVYALAFSGSLLLAAGAPILGAVIRRYGWAIAIPIVASIVVIGLLSPLFRGPTMRSPAASRNIYEQQYQMRRFAHDYLKAAVAVNDLGWVSFGAEHEVLDLWGLGNDDARMARAKGDVGWIGTEVAARGIPVAMVYKSWLSESIPDDWELLGCLVAREHVTVADRVVHIYGTTDDNDAARAALQAFAQDVPPGTTVLPPSEC